MSLPLDSEKVSKYTSYNLSSMNTIFLIIIIGTQKHFPKGFVYFNEP